MASEYIDGGTPTRRESDVIVGFTIKEMFLDIRSHLGKLEGMLESKAAKSEVEAIDLRVSTLEKAHTAGEAIIADYKEEIRPAVVRHETELQRWDAVRLNNKSTWAMVLGSVGASASIFAIFKAFS